jgi:hypothetical protein
MGIPGLMLEVGDIVLHSLRNFGHDSADEIKCPQISDTIHLSIEEKGERSKRSSLAVINLPPPFF